jgi:hypothetical protein
MIISHGCYDLEQLVLQEFPEGYLIENSDASV